MNIIKNGREKKFFAHCDECGTDIEYEYSDVCSEKSSLNGAITRTIKCPVCGKVLCVTLRTKEEMDELKGLFGFNSRA